MAVQKIGGQHTSSEEEFKKNSLSPESYIYVSPGDGFEASFYSADLSVGSAWSDSYSESSKVLSKIDGDLRIAPQASVVIELREDLWIPHNRYGILVPTGEIGLTYGLIFAPTKVEPNWKGKLKLRIFNSSSRKVILRKDQKIASLIVFSTSDMVHQTEVRRPTEISVKPPPVFRKFMKSYRDNPNHWAPAAIVFAALIGAIALYLFGSNGE